MKEAPLIAHIIFRLDYGGLENGVVNLVNRLPRDAYRHVILCLAGYGDFRRRIERTDVEVHSLDKRPGKDLGVYARLWKLLRRLRPSIVHTRNLSAVDMQCVAFASGIAGRVHSEHGWEASDPQGCNPKNLRIRRACRPFIHRYAAVSQDLARWLHERIGVPADAIAQIYNGVDTEKFAPRDARPRDWPWAVDPRTVVIGTVGRFDPIKNQAALVQAFFEVAQRYPERSLRLALIGDGPLMPALRELVAKLNIEDRVWMPGARNDVADCLRAMDIFVLPSLNEGISNTILEAMATGRPVVAARVGGNSELVESGQTGTLYAPDAPGGLTEALRGYIENPLMVREQGDAARRRACERFSLDAMIRNYDEFYRSVLTQGFQRQQA